MLYVVSGLAVYLLLVGVHYFFLTGLRNKVYALIHIVGAGFALYAVISGMV